MPGGDRTGPLGMGSMTGRGAGFCGGLSAPNFAGAGRGCAMGRGLRYGGGGRGRRNRYFATGQPGWMNYGGYAVDSSRPDPAVEEQMLKNHIERLRQELCAIDKRLAELGAGAGPEKA